MRWGIPEYRLPNRYCRKEIQRILSLPIEIKTGVRVGKDIPLDALNQFDAIFFPQVLKSMHLFQLKGSIWNKSGRGESF